MRLFDQSLFQKAWLSRVPYALEGGAIETDGAGTLLTTCAACTNAIPT